MEYIVLIHSNPQPWGHPTSDYVREHQDLPQEQRDALNAEFEALFAQMQEAGELLGGEALGDPTAATVHRWDAGSRTQSAGPYAETKEHRAGFFVIDVASAERAREIADKMAGPGETVELRPAMWPSG